MISSIKCFQQLYLVQSRRNHRPLPLRVIVALHLGNQTQSTFGPCSPSLGQSRLELIHIASLSSLDGLVIEVVLIDCLTLYLGERGRFPFILLYLFRLREHLKRLYSFLDLGQILKTLHSQFVSTQLFSSDCWRTLGIYQSFFHNFRFEVFGYIVIVVSNLTQHLQSLFSLFYCLLLHGQAFLFRPLRVETSVLFESGTMLLFHIIELIHPDFFPIFQKIVIPLFVLMDGWPVLDLSPSPEVLQFESSLRFGPHQSIVLLFIDPFVLVFAGPDPQDQLLAFSLIFCLLLLQTQVQFPFIQGLFIMVLLHFVQETVPMTNGFLLEVLRLFQNFLVLLLNRSLEPTVLFNSRSYLLQPAIIFIFFQQSHASSLPASHESAVLKEQLPLLPLQLLQRRDSFVLLLLQLQLLSIKFLLLSGWLLLEEMELLPFPAYLNSAFLYLFLQSLLEGFAVLVVYCIEHVMRVEMGEII